MNPLRSILHSTGLLWLTALGARAGAQTQGYVQKAKTIHAAVLLLDGDHLSGKIYGQTAAPFAFYNLDQATRIKPAGWVFTNPYAPGVVTDDIRGRYGELYGKTSSDAYNATSFPVPADATRIDKRSGAYWTVRLSQLSESQIADYDVLLIAPRYYMQLTSLERERLRRFVDGGGTLWVDLANMANVARADDANNLPLAIQVATSVSGNLARQTTSPVLTGEKTVSDADLTLLNTENFGQIGITGVASNAGNPYAGPNEFFQYRPIVTVGNGANPTGVISEAHLGDGEIVVTARGAAELLNQGSAQYALAGLTTTPAQANVGYSAKDVVPPQNAFSQAAARLAINIAGLGPSFRQPGGGAHNTSSAAAEPGSPVLSRFVAQGGSIGFPNNTLSGTPGGAVTYKGYLVTTVGNRVAVFDAVPGRDLDGDGDPDDGIVDSTGVVQNAWRDTSVGKPYDLVWISADLGSTLSAPVCAEVPLAIQPGIGVAGANAAAKRDDVDQILVTDAAGRLHAFPLVSHVSNYKVVGGVYNASNNALTNNEIFIPGLTRRYPLPAPNGFGTGYPLLPPTVYDGIAYMTVPSGSNGNGYVWAVDLALGRVMGTGNGGGTPDTPWVVDGTSFGRPLPRFTAAPTLGAIPASDSPGGVDRVLYAPGGFVNGATSQPGFVSLWVGAKGETPATVSATGGVLTVTTHAAAAQMTPYFPTGGDSYSRKVLAPRLTILQNGVPINPATYVTGGPSPGSAGEILYTTPSLTDAVIAANNLTFRVDYTVDWGMASGINARSVERGRILLPIYRGNGLNAGVSDNKKILGPIALTPHGTLHLIEGTGDVNSNSTVLTGTNPGSSDSYFAIREDLAVRGQFRVVARYTLNQQYVQSFGGLAGTTVPAVLGDADAVQGFFPPALRNLAAFNTFTNFHFVGGVALRGGVAFAAVNANRATFIPVTALMAFRAEPETAELRLGTDATAPRITQADFARSRVSATIQVPTQSTISGNALAVDTDAGVVRIENLAGVTVTGEITDCLSESQPIGVSPSGTGTYVYRQPDSAGDRWSPLLWFGLWNGGTAIGTPVVAGESVFLPVASQLPDILAGVNPASAKYRPLLWSMDADAPTSGQYAVALPDRPWITQQSQLILTPSLSASPYFRMPQNRGITTPGDYVARLLETKLGDTTYNYTNASGLINSSTGGKANVGVISGDGLVGVITDAGVFGLSRADFLVCDEGRLLRVDSAGNPSAVTFGARFTGVGGGGSAADLRPLVRPVKAYPVGTSDTLIVDAGGNRIVRIDEDGAVERSIDRILLDPNHRPAAYRANEPLTFKDPRDVTTWEGYVYRASGDPELLTSQTVGYEYWVHHLIADSANGRLVELVDRFAVDQNSGAIQSPIVFTNQSDPEFPGQSLSVPQVGVLLWQSPDLGQASGIGSFYHSVSRVFVGSLNNGTGRYVYVAGTSRTRPTRTSAGLDSPSNATGQPVSGAGGGGVVVFDPIGGVRVIDRFDLPSRATTKFFVPNAANTPTVGAFVLDPTRVEQKNRPFAGVQAVTSRTDVDATGNAMLRIMVTDADAVYEFFVDPASLANPAVDLGLVEQPDWMINETAFGALRGTLDNNTGVYTLGSDPLRFRPAFARRLDSGEVLLVNGYSGLMQDGVTAYTGEVTMLDGAPFDSTTYGFGVNNLGFYSGSLRFTLPPLTGIRGLVSPVFADRR